MNEPKPVRVSKGLIKSHVPGRIRFKLHSRSRNRETMEDIQHRLQTMAGIHTVRQNSACGSMTVQYDHARHTMGGILKILEDVDVMVESIGHLPEIGESIQSQGQPAPNILNAINDLNQHFSKSTGLPVDLKILLPLSFLTAGIWSVTRRGLMLESVPSWVFLWLSFDLFVKLHPPSPRQP